MKNKKLLLGLGITAVVMTGVLVVKKLMEKATDPFDLGEEYFEEEENSPEEKKCSCGGTCTCHCNHAESEEAVEASIGETTE